MILDSLLSIIAPHECISCTAEGRLLCADCSATLSPALSKCYKCQNPSIGFVTCCMCLPGSPLGAVYAAVAYKAHAKDIVWKLKFGRARGAASEIASLISSRLNIPVKLQKLRAAQRASIIVTHAPTANSRARQRGYDQAALIARSIARQNGLKYQPLLLRRGNQKQMGATRLQRAAQLQDAYYAIRPAALRGKYIILIDDVVTTGATLEAAAKVLMEHGARRVDAIAFAQA